MERIITDSLMEGFAEHLTMEEKSSLTVEKYLRDCEKFRQFAGDRSIDKEDVVCYKKRLLAEGYAPRSVNSMLASLNSLFVYAGWHTCRVRELRIQREIFCPEDKELSRNEYERLVRCAEQRGKTRLSLIVQTICGTGIRVSELKYITSEALNAGKASVNCKGKIRIVFIPGQLKKKLKKYADKNKIRSGPLFLTKGGKPVSRTDVWREMKGLCRGAQVSPRKVFPHNLRHLFARVFYKIEKDIVKLADILGHASI